VPVTKPTGRHKNLSSALYRFLVDRCAAHQRCNRIARAFLLRSLFALPRRRLLLLRIGRLIGLPPTHRRAQQQGTHNTPDTQNTKVAIGHSLSPGSPCEMIAHRRLKLTFTKGIQDDGNSDARQLRAPKSAHPQNRFPDLTNLLSFLYSSPL